MVSARVIRTASRDRFNPGTDAAAPINPGQSFGFSLRQRFARFARSNCSALIDRIVSVSCGSHSRPRGDWKTTSNDECEQNEYRKDAEVKLPQLLLVDLAGEQSELGFVLQMRIHCLSATMRLCQQLWRVRWCNTLCGKMPADAQIGRIFSFFDGLMRCPRVARCLLLRLNCFQSVSGHALQTRFAFALYFFPPRKAPPRWRSASPLPDAPHPRCPGVRG